MANTYQLPSTLYADRIATTTFGFGNRTDFTAVRNDPDDIPTNDALNILPDSQPFKYRRDASMVIGTEPKFKMKDAELIKNHQAAFFGRESPGPAAVGDEYGPKFTITKPKLAPAAPFGIKTGAKNWVNPSGNPPDVGPGRHERKDTAIGPQFLTQRRNPQTHEFPHAPKFPKDHNERKVENISKLDAARSCFGKQVLNKNRSEPSVGFSVDTRDIRSRTKLCMTKLDEGPKATFPKCHFSMPSLPPERAVMASGFG